VIRHDSPEWRELRAYARGYLAGHAAAASDELVATALEDLAGALLADIGAGLTQARAIAHQAEHDVALEHPELCDTTRRALEAQRICRIVLRRLAVHEAAALPEAA
jgi:hypothetical protein